MKNIFNKLVVLVLKVFFKNFIFVNSYQKFNQNRKKFSHHHPVIKKYVDLNNNLKAKIIGNYPADFSGAFYSPAYYTGSMNKNMDIGKDDEYFEWLSNLMSAIQAKNNYVMYELGAGYGRWGVRAYLAAKLNNIKDIKIYFVEAESTHIKFLKQHIKLNNLEKKEYKIIDKALSDKSENSFLYIKGPKNPKSKVFDNPTNWYGQRIIHDYEKDSKNLRKTHKEYNGQMVYLTPSNWEVVKVNKIDALELFNENLIDLINFDIQGEELKIIKRVIKKINQNTKRLHISTHSEEIHKKLSLLLKINGWVELYNFKLLSKNSTPIGMTDIGDGVLVFLNSRFKQIYG